MTHRPLQRRTFARVAAGIATVGVAGCFHEGEQDPGPPEADEDDGGEEDDDFVENGDDQAGNETDNPDEDDGDDEDDEEDEDSQDLSQWQDVEEIQLEAHADGWTGVSPDPIEGETNPVITLFLGREYTFTIENGDGNEHDLRIENAAGEVIEDYESDDVEEEGEEASLEVEATDEMVLYYCSYHAEDMAGDLRTEEDRDFEDPEDDVVEDDDTVHNESGEDED